ncbi:hypothetical protein LTR37_003404 [Vermiconidia calcicola]|uniref:Uncharacterized protein n=1 Tax=Vermiconidia calcicola TaxID=1690605 RepID=A0ACC3NQN8_9PEZI|nr:hypothetical protein LTR37_003404 [Vermiconidia calcicola]
MNNNNTYMQPAPTGYNHWGSTDLADDNIPSLATERPPGKSREQLQPQNSTPSSLSSVMFDGGSETQNTMADLLPRAGASSTAARRSGYPPHGANRSKFDGGCYQTNFEER